MKARKIITFGSLIALVIFMAYFYRYFSNFPVDKGNSEPVFLEVPVGAGAKKIAMILEEKDIIRSRWGFLVRLYLSGSKEKLQAGNYSFSRQESGRTIIERLEKGDTLPMDYKVTIPEGLTVKEIAERLEKAQIVSSADFLKKAKSENFRSQFAFLAGVPDGDLEGYLFPDTYQFYKNTPPENVIERMLSRFNDQFIVAVKGSGGLKGKALHEVVIMASIIEREVRSIEDRKKVSDILWSRLESGVALAADATTRYALNNWDRPLTVEDLKINNPYNTRTNAGLPPGPIGNPGLTALQAAMDPTDTNYFYYLSAKDGTTVFSATLEEHNQNINRYLR